MKSLISYFLEKQLGFFTFKRAISDALISFMLGIYILAVDFTSFPHIVYTLRNYPFGPVGVIICSAATSCISENPSYWGNEISLYLNVFSSFRLFNFLIECSTQRI